MNEKVKEVVNMVLSILFIFVVGATIGGIIVGACVHITRAHGTVMLDDWEHGVAICGEEEVPTVVAEATFTVVTRNTYMLLINDGHQGDPQVLTLAKKAKAYCDQLAGQ